jgi:hypothetical protein
VVRRGGGGQGGGARGGGRGDSGRHAIMLGAPTDNGLRRMRVRPWWPVTTRVGA